MNNKFYDYRIHGITQGLISKFMSCREETKLFLEGWVPKKVSSSALTFGSIVHGTLERIYNDVRTKKIRICPDLKIIQNELKIAETIYYKENPSSSETRQLVENSLLVAEATLLHYFKKYWKHDVSKIRWEQIEQTFSIPYVTKDGRKTFIRGRKDGVFKNPGLWLFETKTKSMINEGNLVDTLSFELQVNLYLWAIRKLYKAIPAGVLYNVIRRTCLERKKTESFPEFAKRISDDIFNRPEFYFMRYEIIVGKKEMDLWENELEGMVVDIMNWCEGKLPHYRNTGQCITKYGRCPMLSICSSQSFHLYTKRKVVFNELENY